MLERGLWAKSDPYHPLWCHLLDVAAVCDGLLPRFGGVPPLPDRWVALLAALHDIGKADPWFQNKDDDLAAALRRDGLALPEWGATADDSLRKFRHEARSAEWLLDWLVGDQAWGRHAARVAATAVRGHHGDFNPEHHYSETAAQRAEWDPLRAALCRLVRDALQPPAFEPDRFEDASAAGARLSGLIVLADWIASNDELYPYPKLDRSLAPAEYFAAGCREAAAVLRRMGLDAPATTLSGGAPAFHDVWPRLGGLRPIQSRLDELAREGLPVGLAIIEAPMGEGKTEAAVYLAECWNARAARRGSYLALPTQATANQMHDRYRQFLQACRPGDAGPRLVHGMAWLIDEPAPAALPQTFGGGDNPRAEQLARSWFRPARRALLAPEGVGTVDQALLAALHVKFGFLRLLGLGAKTLIVDEVHAYDDYMTTILERLLAWCRALEVGVILLSATLSREQKRKLCAAYAGPGRAPEVQAAFDERPPEETPYPLLTFVALDEPPRLVPVAGDPGRARRVALEPHPGLLADPAGAARLAASLVEGGGCACVLANTVAAAQEIFRELRRLQGDGTLPASELHLFHARFRAERRNDIEERVTGLFGKGAGERRPRRAILVATQVVEQSLDVDFDVMLSQVAPVDLLLQRSGRMWRHDRRDRGGATRPALHLLLPPDGDLDFGPTEKVYAREILLRTLAILHGRPAFDLPGDFRPLIEGCYGRTPLPGGLVPEEELQKAARERDGVRAEHASLARRHLLPEPTPGAFEMVRPSAAEPEGEGEAGSYFVAQTRLGDQTRPALVLHDPDLFELAKADLEEAKKPRRDRKAPPRDQLRQLFLQKVNLPAWWLVGAGPRDGHEPYFEGQAWLRGHLVLPLRGGEWRGLDRKGKPFVIRDDPDLGLQRIATTGDEDHGEADAGQTA